MRNVNVTDASLMFINLYLLQYWQISFIVFHRKQHEIVKNIDLFIFFETQQIFWCNKKEKFN